MKHLILMLSILSLLLFGAWGCSEQSDQSAKAPEEKTSGTVETTQAGTILNTEAAEEKAKKVIEELKEKTEGATEETKE